MAISVERRPRAVIGMFRTNAPRTKFLVRGDGVGTVADAVIGWSGAPMHARMPVAAQQLRSKAPTTYRLLYGTEPTASHCHVMLQPHITVNRHIPAYRGNRNEDLYDQFA